MRRLTSLALLAHLLAGTVAQEAPFVGAYYANWLKAQTPVASIPFDKLSTVQYFAGVPTAQGDLSDYDSVLASQVVAAAKSAGKKVDFVVGGWGGSTHFSTLLGDEALKHTFATKLDQIVKSGGFSGLEIDWEYPGGGVDSRVGMTCNSKSDSDGAKLVDFAKHMRAHLGEGFKVGISVDSLGIKGLADYKELSAAVDYCVIMAYDSANPNISKDRVGANSPLYNCGIPGSAAGAIDHFLSKGFQAKKLVLGLPAYGYGWGGMPIAPVSLPAPFAGQPAGGKLVSAPGPDTCGTMLPASANINFNELIDMKRLDASGMNAGAGWTRTWDKCSQTPFLYGEQTTISYDDPQSIALKVSLARCKGLGGFTFFSITGDSTDRLLLDAAIKGFTGTDPCPQPSSDNSTNASASLSSAASSSAPATSSNSVSAPTPSGLIPPDSSSRSTRAPFLLLALVVLLYDFAFTA